MSNTYQSHLSRETICSMSSLQEELKLADQTLLMRILMEEHVLRVFSRSRRALEQRHAIKKSLLSSLEKMETLPLVQESETFRLLMPEESFILHGLTGFIERKVSARLVLAEDIQFAAKRLKRKPAARSRKNECLKNTNGWPLPYAYSFDPWAEILATKVWLKGTSSCWEAYQVLASACWEMTFYQVADDYLFPLPSYPAQNSVEALLAEKAEILSPELGYQSAYDDPHSTWGRMRKEYSLTLESCVGSLNEAAHRRFWQQAVQLAAGPGSTDSSGKRQIP